VKPKPLFPLVLAAVFAGACSVVSFAADSPREHLSLDTNWKFHLGDDWPSALRLDKAGESGGPAAEKFNDQGWRTLNLPHDWAIELPFDPNADTSHGFKPLGPGYPKNSIGWYRRTFELPKDDQGKRIWLQFDGVFRDSTVWVNGWLVGRHESGYHPFRHDITDIVHFGGKNTVTVKADASKFEGWFYEGAGIYRHVWLDKTAPVAIAQYGVFVSSQFKQNVPDGPARIQVKVTVLNTQMKPAAVTVSCKCIGPKGTASGGGFKQSGEVQAAGNREFDLSQAIRSPELWSPESPALYKLATTVEADGKVVDSKETEFGIRTVAFDQDRGFLLNGKPYVLKGTCNHQDMAGVGAALPDALQYFRVARLKEFGCNSYRTSHNPPTPELLDACDHLGMIVMDESRLLGSDEENLRRWDMQILRDRNHPSVGIWSVANEEFVVQSTPQGGNVARTMQDYVKRLDPLRPVTYAAPEGDSFAGINGIIEVRGWNYHVGPDMDKYHAKQPAQPNVGTEQASTVCTRGIYQNDKQRGYVSAYDDNAPDWATTTERWWSYFADRPWLSGGFVWTGFDYRGEPTPYAWPCINSHFGVLDTCGFAKDNFYYYQAWWTQRAMVHLLPHWTWPGKEGQEIDVRCFSNCDEVEAFLNGQSLGKQAMPRNSHLRWKVKYAPGTLLARGFKAGQVVAEDKVETTGAPSALKLSPDRPAIHADGEDVGVVTVAVVDAQGRFVPMADNLVRFELSGPGKILGVGNGDPSCHEPDTYIDQAPTRSLSLDQWRMKGVPNPNERPEVAEEVKDGDWDLVDARAASGPLNPGQSAVFRTRFTAKAEDLAARSVTIVFGMIDDEGWVYVNGRLAGESHDWSSSPVFDIRKFLHSGENVIAVAVKNNEAQGGLNKGVTVQIAEKPTPPDWKRSVFNGLAQIILQSTSERGELKLTAHADGVAPATLSVPTQPYPAKPTVP
jgi:beta-galactosidase